MLGVEVLYQVNAEPVGKLLAVTFDKSTVVCGQTFVKLVLAMAGAVLPAVQVAQVIILTVMALLVAGL